MTPEPFAQLVARSGTDLTLDETALAISSTLTGPIDDVEWLAALDQLAADCPTPTAEGIARHLAEVGFRGNRTAYYDWRNSCLDRVIAERTGIPITLSIVMIEVGRRLGVPLVGVGMPAHFLVGCVDEPVYFDPFHGPDALDRGDVRVLFDQLVGPQTGWEARFLEPTPPRAIIARMLNNLQAIFTARKDPLRLALVMAMRSAMPELRARDRDTLDAALAPFN